MASYLALSVCPHATASSWWDAADGETFRRDRRASEGARTVEVTPDKPARELAWARGLTGWTTADLRSVWLYQPAGAVASG